MKRKIFLLLLTISSLLLSGCSSPLESTGEGGSDVTALARSSEQEEKLRVLTIGTADSGGTMYPVGMAIAQAIASHDTNIKINLSASNGSLTNVEELTTGQFDLGLVSGDAAFCAYFGTDEFEGQPVKSLTAIGAVYSSLSNWMVPDSAGISYVHELTGHRAAIGPQDSTTELAARIALSAAGINEENTSLVNLGLGSGSQQVEEGELDAVHGFAGIPISSLTALSEAVPSHLLLYTPEELKEIISSNPFYYKAVIPAGTYPGQLSDVDTFGIKCLLCVRDDMEEELVYSITRMLDESTPQLAESHPSLQSLTQKGYLCGDLPIPLHPGAERYYREMGYLEE